MQAQLVLHDSDDDVGSDAYAEDGEAVTKVTPLSMPGVVRGTSHSKARLHIPILPDCICMLSVLQMYTVVYSCCHWRTGWQQHQCCKMGGTSLLCASVCLWATLGLNPISTAPG